MSQFKIYHKHVTHIIHVIQYTYCQKVHSCYILNRKSYLSLERVLNEKQSSCFQSTKYFLLLEDVVNKYI
jgi:hypothetical protein